MKYLLGARLEESPIQDRVDIDGNRLGDLVTPVCGSRTVAAFASGE